MRREISIFLLIAMIFLPWLLSAAPQETKLVTSNIALKEHQLQEITRKFIEVSADRHLQNKCIELHVRAEKHSSQIAYVTLEPTPIQPPNSHTDSLCHVVVVTKLLLSFANDNDVTSIIAHELGHIAHYDVTFDRKKIFFRTLVRILSLNTIRHKPRRNEYHDQRLANAYAIALLERYGADPWTMVYASEKIDKWLFESEVVHFSEPKDSPQTLELKKLLDERRGNQREQK
ncbi:MAG: M48 family metalloprotease [bacterium]|nr:M48 family metalloprotease [bacterium]